MKDRVFQWLVGASREDDKTSTYDVIMMVAIMSSMLPLMVKGVTKWEIVLDWTVSIIFIIDYLLRWWTADLKLKKGVASYMLYPLTPMAIVDMLSILPVLAGLASGFRLLRLSRLLRTFRIFRAFKLIRYSKSCIMIRNAIYEQRHALVSAYMFASAYMFVAALLVFNVEPQTFDTFWDAVYWAAVSLTTVGYGDIYPVSAIGRCVTVLSAFVGVAIVALPAGIITAGYMAELSKAKSEDEKR